MSNKTFLKIFLIFLAFGLLDGKRDFSIEMMKVKPFVIDNSFMKTFNCILYSRKVLYCELEFLKDMTDMVVRFNLNSFNKNKPRVNMIHTDVKACESLEKTQKIKFLKLLIKGVLNVSNFPQKCPLTPNNLYTVKNYSVNDDDYPQMLPTIEGEITMELISGKHSRANISIMGRVRKL
ncbi:uncharacterized protein LOC131994337 [Stomoxys calcitrans]|uniref:uncharacterized protein LOC131994337 n=1 Tax=Stomoxys calcitrans TaxID=35570 RepID=UPI0027E2798B|nr:uncharacterized protein LOC131994337 [Stomoxys calcitrans]